MYSPKIEEPLIPVLYRRAKERQMPMTQLVALLIRQALGDDPLLQSAVMVNASGQSPSDNAAGAPVVPAVRPKPPRPDALALYCRRN